MKAILVTKFGSPNAMRWTEVPEQEPQPGQVKVALRCAAINFPDLLMIQGKYQVKPELPFIPGREGCGVVSSVGEGVSAVRVGDRVMVQGEHGMFAEQVIVPEGLCFKVPEGVNDAEAAAVGIAYQTAHFALFQRAQLRPEESVLVLGATSSVGIAAVQLARNNGATVVAGVTTEAKSPIARANGAHHVVNLSAPDLRESLREQVKAALQQGVDVVIDTVGGEAFGAALRAMNFEGRLVVVGFTSGEIPSFRANYALLKNLTIQGLNWSTYRQTRLEQVRDVQKELFHAASAGRLRIPVQQTLIMEDFAEAFAILTDRQVQGKVVLRVP